MGPPPKVAVLEGTRPAPPPVHHIKVGVFLQDPPEAKGEGLTLPLRNPLRLKMIY